MDWLEIAVAADDEAVEAVAEVLRAHGHGVAIEEPFVQPSLDQPPQRDPSRRPVVKTYIADDREAAKVRQRIEEALWHVGQLRAVEPLAVRRIAEDDWANAWKPFFPVLHVGRRTVIVPAWRRYRRRGNEIIVRLDPGLAFGTGMHPTTRLCLLAIESLVQPGALVLDVGTGSGILAIAAARAGAARVVGLDNDPLAVDSARKNVRLNRLSRVASISEGAVHQFVSAASRARFGADRQQVGFDVILSNITAQVNASLAESLAALLRAGGRLVASGILEDSGQLVVDAFASAGLQTIDCRRDGDWIAITATLAA